jgi:hypothetical protein
MAESQSSRSSSVCVASRLVLYVVILVSFVSSGLAQNSCVMPQPVKRPSCVVDPPDGVPERTVACASGLAITENNRCEGYPTLQTSSGDATVTSYTVPKFERGLKSFILTWTCPDRNSMVRAKISLGNGYTFTSLLNEPIPCSAGRFEVPSSLGQKSFNRDQHIYAVAELATKACEIPRFLRATLQIPAELGRRNKGFLEDSFDGTPVLTVYSNQPANWTVTVLSRRKVIAESSPKPNGGQLGNFSITVPNQQQICEFLAAHADRGDNPKGNTWIAELQQ